MCCDILGVFGSNLSQQHPTCYNRVAKSVEQVAPSNVVPCCVEMYVVIIWPGLKRYDWLMVTIIGVEPLIERFRHKLLLGSCVVFLVRTLYYHSTSFYPEISKGFWNKCNKLLFYQKESNHLDVVFRRVLQKLKACRQNPLGRELSCVK